MLRNRESVAIFFCVVFGIAGTAHAYIDPGTGSFFFQMLAAAIFGALFAIRNRWKQVRGWLHRRLENHHHDSAEK
jgi:hypothetical protein